MPSIDIQRKHGLGLKKARAVVEDIAYAMAERFEFESAWNGDTLLFERSGVRGGIVVAADSVRVHADLGFMLMLMKPAIEDEIRRHLDEHFA
ncbi:putative polyhydroxyalkanoic acid system protein [Mizugakiibacter sediminis]|uniref:Polyhydroxyalkanoic acid synthase n=1 Tax=Mizugakiibacter sediminis TaxID=1475481 RepID=A0A0K8QQ45_9GAMM|nr:polyhydroxyalkanoic acid system family protein [Mizugakiibacter sediminis]GAP66993.1 putative polyhydroxyalkanoic acid system protein [Mizugakiibacter sediminis]